MKKLLLLIGAIALIGFAADYGLAQGKRIAFGEYTTNTVAATPVRLCITNLWVERATVLGKKAARTDNTSVAYLGVNSTNNTQWFPLTAGGEVQIIAPEGSVFNLYDWYVDVGADDDGVIVIYQ